MWANVGTLSKSSETLITDKERNKVIFQFRVAMTRVKLQLNHVETTTPNKTIKPSLCNAIVVRAPTICCFY